MTAPSSSGVGFRVVIRRPLIPLAEISWRWTIGAAIWALGAGFIFEYFGSLPVRTLDRLLLSTGQPFLIWRALRDIFSGTAFRFVEAAIFVALGLTLAWIFVASLGRLAIVRSMIAEFGTEPPASRNAFGNLLFLNFVRAAVALAAIVGIAGATLMTSSWWASTHVAVADAVRIVFLLWFVTALAWIVLNWLLSTAAVFVIARQESAFSAITSTLRTLQDRPAAMVAPGVLFGVPHVIGFGATFCLVLFLAPIAAGHPGALLVLWAVVLLYSVFADFLYTGRLAAYAYLATGSEGWPVWMARRTPPPLHPGGFSASVDKDELILGDLPSPA